MFQNLMLLNFTKKYVFIFSLLLTIGGYFANNAWGSYTRRMLLNKLRKCKQKQKLTAKGKIGEELRVADDQKELKRLICQMSMENLIEYLRKDVNNYKVVFQAFQTKALQEDQRLNCIVEFFRLDASEVNLDGPLSGIPVSIKDNITVKGYDSYVGCSIFLNKPKPIENSVLVKVLLKLGAIPFAKTTVPQTTMTILSSNPVDGMTKNPQNINFIPGGSSSGEAAMIGSGASILGFGTDLGGSIRIPAAFCGVVGFKPTVDRMSMSGDFNLGIPSLVKSVDGPICRDVKSCAFVIRTIYDSGLMSSYDPLVPPMPFNNEDFEKKKMKIGYFTHDDSFHVMPAMRRAVEESVIKLRGKGHELVLWKPPRSGRDWWRMFIRGVTIDGNCKMLSIIKDDKIDEAINNRTLHVDFSFWNEIFNYLKYSLPNFIINPDQKNLYKYCKERLSSDQCLALMDEINSFKRELLNDWSRNNLDAVLCPASGFTALPTKSESFFCPLLSYMFIWNLVNFPAGTVPVTKVHQKDLDEMKNDPIYRSTQTLRGVSKDQMGTLNLSVSVQCVGPPWKDELCLNLMKELE